MQKILRTLGRSKNSPRVKGKSILPKTPHALDIRHREFELESISSLPLWRLAFIVLEGAI